MKKRSLIIPIIIIIVIYFLYRNNVVLAESPVIIDSTLESNVRNSICTALIEFTKEKDFIYFCKQMGPYGPTSFYNKYFSDSSYIENFVNKLPLNQIFQDLYLQGADKIMEHIFQLFHEDVIKTKAKFKSESYFIPQVFFNNKVLLIISEVQFTTHFLDVHHLATEKIPIITPKIYAAYDQLRFANIDKEIISTAIYISGDSNGISLEIEFIYKYFDIVLPIKIKWLLNRFI